MPDRYGPQTEQILQLIERLRNATPEQLQAIADAYDIAISGNATAVGGVVEVVVAIDVGDGSVRDTAMDGADATYAATIHDDTHAHDVAHAAYAAYVAAYALAIRDFAGADGFTWEHYKTLTDPVTSVLGPIHPDDE